MPFNIQNASASPSSIKIPGTTTVSFQLTGTAGITLRIEYRLSPGNKIFFASGQKVEPGGQTTLTGGTMNKSKQLSFIENGNEQGSFFVTILATNISNGATKTQTIQLAIQ